MRKIKFMSSSFNKETGISEVVVQNKYGMFKGYSKLHPDDIPFASQYTGCNFAEQRAVIKAMKAELKFLKAHYEGYLDATLALSDSWVDKENNKCSRWLAIQSQYLMSEIMKLEQEIKSAKERLTKAINARNVYNEKVKN